MDRETLRQTIIALATEAERVDRPAAGILLSLAARWNSGRLPARSVGETLDCAMDWRIRYWGETLMHPSPSDANGHSPGISRGVAAFLSQTL